MTEIHWNRMSAETLRERAAADAVVLLPVASTEQHGPHLATGVDDILCSEVCRRAGEQLLSKGVPAVVAPTLWAGLAEHHVTFGGTFTLSVATYRAVLEDLCRSILRAGFRRIAIINGHGGNMSALNAFSAELNRDLDAPIVVATYWEVADEAFSEILEDQRSILHACEGETSMMLTVRPDLVARERLSEAVGPQADRAGSVLKSPLHRWRSFKEMTPTGIFGDARRATAEKGERLLEAAAGALATRLASDEPWA